MNAARRAMIRDLRQQGLTGKEAYEATKKSEFAQKWLRVVAPWKIRIGGFSKKTIPTNPDTWMSRHMQNVAKKEAEKVKKANQKHTEKVERSRFLQRAMSSGLSLGRALLRWDERGKEKNEQSPDVGS